MAVNLSIRNVPEEIAERLRERAKANHRSLQGELRAVIEEAVAGPARPNHLREVATEIRNLGLPHTKRNESTQMIREDRDRR